MDLTKHPRLFISRIYSLFAVLITLSILLASIWAYISVQHIFDERVDATKTALDLELKQLAFLPNLLAEDPRLRRALSAPPVDNMIYINRVLALWAKQSSVEHVFLMNENGSTVAASNWDKSASFVGKNYGFRPYFKEAINNGNATFFAVGATTGLPGYFIASAVANKKGRHVGVVVIKVAPQNLIGRLSQTSRNWLLVDDLGVSILSNRQDWLYRIWRTESRQSEAANAQARYTINQPNFIRFNPEQEKGWFRSSENIFDGGLYKEVPTTQEPWSLVVALTSTELAPLFLSRLLFTGLVALLGLMLYFTLQRERLRHYELQQQAVRIRTQLELAQQELVRKENWATLGRMSGVIAHEINQPLASLRFDLASLDKMIESNVQNSKALSLQTIRDAKSTLAKIIRIIETLRLFSRQNELELTVVDVNQVIQDARVRFTKDRPIVSRYLTVENTLKQPALVMSNSVLLEQVIMNLLTNAATAASNTKPSVTLSGPVLEGKTISVRVSDNGEAWPEYLLEHDWTTPTSTKSINENFGLGLSLCASFMDKTEGSMSATRQDGLTCVTITLPAAETQQRQNDEQ